MKRILFVLISLLSITSFAQSWQSKTIVRVENQTASYLCTFSDSSNAYIQKSNVSYIVNQPNSVYAQVGYMYDGSTSRIITINYSTITQPDLGSAKELSDTLNAWLNEPSTGGGSSSGIDSIYFPRTFQQFINQMTAHTLKAGASYEMTDFATIYDQPDFQSDGTPKASVVTKTASAERLVFIANSDRTFAEFVSSIDYPTDRLKFDFSFTETEVMNEPVKGRIAYREDIKGNISDYDWRKVVYLRYESSTGSGVFNQWKDNGEASAEYPVYGLYQYSFGNIHTGYCTAYTLLGQVFILPNVVYQGTAIKNKFDVVYNSTFVGDCNENFIGDGSRNITGNAGMYYNYFGHQAIDVTFLGNSEDNYFGDSTSNCIFGDRCNANSIWDKMTNFTAGTDFQRNIQYGNWMNSTVGDAFTDGVIYGLTDSITAGNYNFKIEMKSALAITIGDNNSNISFGGTKHILPLNDIDGISNVSFGGSIDGYWWANGITFLLHPEMYDTTTKTVVKTPNGNVYTRYLNNALTDVITIID